VNAQKTARLVVSRGQDSATYTLRITRNAKAPADKRARIYRITEGPFTLATRPAFSPGLFTYTTMLANSTTSVTITAEPVSADAVYSSITRVDTGAATSQTWTFPENTRFIRQEITGLKALPGVASSIVTLNGNVDGEMFSISHTIIRAAQSDANADLRGITLQALSTDFSADSNRLAVSEEVVIDAAAAPAGTLTFRVTLPRGHRIQVTPYVSDSMAEVYIQSRLSVPPGACCLLDGENTLHGKGGVFFVPRGHANTFLGLDVEVFTRGGDSQFHAILITRPQTPTAPAELAAASGDMALTFTWAAPAESDRPDIESYRLRWSNDGDASTWENAGGYLGIMLSAPMHTLSGIPNGVEYTVQVAAVSEHGAGAWSIPLAAEAFAKPGMPHRLAAAAGDRELLMVWEVPRKSGGATPQELSYQVQWRLGSAAAFGTAVDVAAGTTTYAIGGLTNDSEYVVQVRAINMLGMSGWAEVRATPSTFNIDLDASGAADWIDGVLIARFLAGARAGDLSAGLSLASGASADSVAAILTKNRDALDVDGLPGVTLRDGILIARYLLGVTSGAGLYEGQVAASEEAEVIRRIRDLLP